MSKESYVAGFTKVAEAYGVDPVALMKIAQVTPAGIGPRIQPEGVPGLIGGVAQYSTTIPKVDELAETLFPGKVPRGRSRLHYLTGKPVRYVELGGDVAKWNWGDFLNYMSEGSYPRGRVQPAEDAVNSRYSEIISKLESSNLPNKDALIQKAKANHAKARGLVEDAYIGSGIGRSHERWVSPESRVTPLRPKVVPKPAPETAIDMSKMPLTWLKRIGNILKKAR